MPGWEQLGMQAAGNVVGGAMGLILGGINDRRQLNQQQRLQNLQIQGQKEMTDYNMWRQLQMWERTSYPGQIEMMKKAGLNPALIYDNGGQGAATNIATGSVQATDAPKGGGEALGMGLTMGNIGLIAAQTKLAEAQAEKTKAETTAVAPEIEKTKVETASITQGIENQKVAAELLDAQKYATNVMADINARSSNSQVASFARRVEQETEEVKRMMRENGIGDATIQDKINQIKSEALTTATENLLKEQQITASKEQIAAMWTELSQKWASLGLQERNTAVQEKLANLSRGKLTLEKQQTIIRAVESIMNRLMPAPSTILSQLKPAL